MAVAYKVTRKVGNNRRFMVCGPPFIGGGGKVCGLAVSFLEVGLGVVDGCYRGSGLWRQLLLCSA